MDPASRHVDTKHSTVFSVQSKLADLEADFKAYRRATERFQTDAEKLLKTLHAFLPNQPRPIEPSSNDHETEPPAVNLLSNREIEILRLIAEGHSTKEAATAMGIAFKTAVGHRSKRMEKLGIYDTANLARYAIRIGLIEP